MQLDGINHVALTVTNPEKSAEWYRDVLGFEITGVNKPGNPLKITLGDQWLAIFPVGKNPGSHPKRNDLAFQHLAFGSDFKNWEKSCEELKQKNIEYKFVDHGNCYSIYFDDPDGHRLEIVTYDIEKK